MVIAGGGASLRTLDERVRRLARGQPGPGSGDRTARLRGAASLVAAADLLIMPSLHEGAGLPPLEAMAHTRPFCRRTSRSLRETCGDGADYFDPHDSDGLARLIRTHCTDDAARADLARRGYAHVVQRQQRICATAAADEICTELARDRDRDSLQTRATGRRVCRGRLGGPAGLSAATAAPSSTSGSSAPRGTGSRMIRSAIQAAVAAAAIRGHAVLPRGIYRFAQRRPEDQRRSS